MPEADPTAAPGLCTHVPPSPGQLLCQCGHHAIELEYAARLAEAEERLEGNDRMHRALSQAKDRQLLTLERRVAAVAAVCDDWDVLTKGPSPTTVRIRRALEAHP